LTNPSTRANDPRGRPPFLTDLAHVASLEGQCYVVVRVGGAVESLFLDMKARLLNRLHGASAIGPTTGHVTLRGFPNESASGRIDEVVATWAAKTPPLLIETDGLSVFGAPHQVVILRVMKTPELVRAYSQLAELAAEAGLASLAGSMKTVADWTFHVSVLYCKELPRTEWESLVGLVAGLSVPPAQWVADDAELVCFAGGVERRTTFRLTGNASCALS